MTLVGLFFLFVISCLFIAKSLRELTKVLLAGVWAVMYGRSASRSER